MTASGGIDGLRATVDQVLAFERFGATRAAAEIGDASELVKAVVLRERALDTSISERVLIPLGRVCRHSWLQTQPAAGCSKHPAILPKSPRAAGVST